MDDEKWYSLLDDLEEKLTFEDRGEDAGPYGARIEWVIFKSPMGRMKLERTSKPVILDRKYRYSRRAGTTADEHLVLSETEKTYRVALYKWMEPRGWEEVDFRQLTG
jgi:hypothetical protein